MEIKELILTPAIEQNPRLKKAYEQFNQLLSELRKRELPLDIANSVNIGIDEINSASTAKQWRSQVRKIQARIIRMLEKELKWVPKNYYRNVWLALGMSAFGIPMGVAFGVSLQNMAFIGIGLPIGMAIGIIIGSGMDKKAAHEGRQLDLEIKA